VTGANFGCGSSREHAPWALQDYGFKAIVAPSFADIFYSNCTKIGLLPVVLPDSDVRDLMTAEAAAIDLELQDVEFLGRGVPFEIDPDIKYRLMHGLDDIALSLEREEDIARYERERQRRGPVTTAL
jgi:3-isopropylmalate/(R)-2-methylmalate dehydratase small subunit